MLSWISKVGTLFPSWDLLTWVWLGTPCKPALSSTCWQCWVAKMSWTTHHASTNTYPKEFHVEKRIQFGKRQLIQWTLTVDGSYMVIYFRLAHFSWDMKHVIIMRWLAYPDWGRSHIHHNFWSSHEWELFITKVRIYVLINWSFKPPTPPHS